MLQVVKTLRVEGSLRYSWCFKRLRMLQVFQVVQMLHVFKVLQMLQVIAEAQGARASLGALDALGSPDRWRDKEKERVMQIKMVE